jgi:hypothetical protein
MNRIRTISFACSLLLLSVLGFCASQSSARETSVHLLRSGDDRLWYINKGTLVRLPEQIVSFWSRVIPRKGSAYFQQKQSVLARAGKNAHQFAFFQRLDEVDCRNNRIRTLSVLFYDENDQILLSRSMLPAGWTAISSGSEHAIVREAVCDNAGTAPDRLSAVLLGTAGE